jgi:hypothetical protein
MTHASARSAARQGTAAERYERRMPGTGVPEAQKQERQERHEFKQERREHRRTGRNRGIVVPADAWDRIFGPKETTAT